MTNPLHDGLGRYFSPQQLTALFSARIGIAGAGGLGSNAALMLARCGVGHITLVDDDVVDAEFTEVADIIALALLPGADLEALRTRVASLTAAFPLYPGLTQ